MVPVLALLTPGPGRGFGLVESSLAIVKIAHNVIFYVVAALIVLALIETSVVFSPGGNLYDELFPDKRVNQ